MREVDRILDQLERSRRGDSWHGPALEEVLADVDAETAAAHPIPGAHSIWELVLHITTWQDVVRRRLTGEAVVPGDDENWRAVEDRSEGAWDAARAALGDARARLEREVASLDDAALDRAPRRGARTRYVLLHGVLQHDLYHAGQMSLLRKALGAPAGDVAG